MTVSKQLVSRPVFAPNLLVSAALFLVVMGVMGYLRLYLYGDRFITLTYGLPLLLCLVYPDRRLLWTLVAGFAAMAWYKAFVLRPTAGPLAESYLLHWTMQLFNLVVIAGTIHVIVRQMAGLRRYAEELEQTNSELMAREEEIGRQNEELLAQAEELSQQNEEIQQQSEETQQQAEELRVQAEELHLSKSEIEKREAILQVLVKSLNSSSTADEHPAVLGQALLSLFSEVATVALVWEVEGGQWKLLSSAGAPVATGSRDPVETSLARVALEGNATAFVEDLARRPDLLVSGLESGSVRSVLASPLYRGAMPCGGIEIYSPHPRAWTKSEFKLLEWAGTQLGVILEIRRLHRQLQQANRDLDGVVRERTAELQEMVNELEHFSYSITHDLRAPLRAMHGFAEMLAEECESHLTDVSREYLRRLTTAAQRMDRLITDALSYSKTVREEVALHPVDPEPLIKGIVESYPDFALPKAEIAIGQPLPRVIANEAGLTQCFSNILGNAVKFVGKGVVPKVQIRAEHQDGRVRLWFEDNGVGIPTEMHSRVFQMFQRASKEFEGTGIGLALVRKVTEKMGGQVGVISEPGRGSRFWVELKSADTSSP